MAQKPFFYRGKNSEELKKLDIREFAKLLPSKRKRSLLRNFQEIDKFFQRCKVKVDRGKKIKTHQRDLIITPQLVGMKIQIHNGKDYIPVDIIWDMIGFRLGEFAPTRKKVAHGAAGIGATRSSSSLSVK